ncbi:molecular chaperone DnaJ [Novosphingobium sp. FSY-8]|uniref:Molecular chaperone DnaJ n=2 Tax=Novosphingobium ovatum TaxID=1908523 RepID=A0ABW9XGQ7_9SPHN|nr:molecular chaperone DnaJ [Novosphingobium ovatum]
MLASLACRVLDGRWPWDIWRAWQKADRARVDRQRARTLLGLGGGAGRQDILDAHRRLMLTVHPDRGGTNDLVHEANAARDLLLTELGDANR